MTPQQFRKFALSFPDAVEAEHMRHPDFRIGGKIFASLGAPSNEWCMVKLTQDQQKAFLEANAESFQPCNGAWGRQGCTNIKLSVANTLAVRSAVTLAVENVTASLPAKHKPAARKRSRSSVSETIVTNIQSHIVKIVESLPEAQAVPAGEGHLSLEIRRKRFGWFLVNHHGDGRIALNCRAPENVRRDLLQLEPDVFYIPKYVGHHGWVGIWLDSNPLDWNRVATILADAFDLTAPQRLVIRRKQSHIRDAETLSMPNSSKRNTTPKVRLKRDPNNDTASGITEIA